MKRTVARFGRAGALTALAMGMTGALLGAVPSAASATAAACGGQVGGGWLSGGNWISVALRSTSSCTMYARLTITDGTAACCFNYGWRVERQVNGTYGWQTTHTKNSSSYAFEGTKDTATVPNSTVDDDRFRACSNFGTSTWRCTPWILA
ncbi:hypothetical protein [Actinoplanes sp. NPDC049316]|uniref:hypothetical protein n=1 Tax=Actinoplanes sp. NPDC049316 TaxID=3154727 RepID=UPI003439063D